MAWDDTKQDGNIVEPTEWNNQVADIKKRLGLVFNVQSYNASPDGGTATTGSITSATPDLVVASASTFEVDHGIVVVGAKLDTTDTGNTEDTDNDFTTTGGAADNEWMARKFTATNSGAIGTVANVMLKKTGAPAGTIVAMIYSDSTGPSAQIGGDSIGVTNTTLNASGAIQTFTWATDWPVQVTGTAFWVVLKTVGYTYADGVTEVIWQTDADGATGLNECYKYDSDGAPWSTMGANVGGDVTVNLNLSTTITAISGTDITLAANATTTVSSAVVRHDEYTAINAAHTAATASGGFIWFPAGTYNLGTSISFNSDSPLWFDQAATLAINSGITATFLNMITPTHTVFSGSGSMTFGTQAITAAGDTITADTLIVMLDSDGAHTLTSTPTIPDGTPGQILYLMMLNAEVNTVILQDQDTLASSNLELLAATRTIAAKTILTLIHDGTVWVEQGSVEYGALTVAGITSTADITIQETAPEFILHNTTEENADGGRESSIRWKGEQDGGEITTLGMIRMSHDGAADDEKGQMEVLVNDTNDADSPTLRLTIDSAGTSTFVGKQAVGSFGSPQDVTATREYGTELHFSGNDYNVTGIRSRASLVTTDAPTRSAIGGRFTGAANDNINANLVEGIYVEALGKATDNAATISNLIGAEVNVEYEDENTITNYKGLYLRLVTDTDLPAAVSYGIHIYNQQKGEADGGTLHAAIYISNNLNPALDAYEYGLDMSGSAGDINTADIRLQNSETIKNTTDGVVEISGDIVGASGILSLAETTTPSADASFGKLYTKSDNNLYFQDGGGTEHTLLKGSTSVQHEFFPPLEDPTGTVGNWDIVQIGTAQSVHFTFQIPEDFEILDAATVVVLPDATETIQWDILVSVAANGEAHNADDRSALNETLAVTANNITELDISGLLTGLTAGDYIAVDFQSDTANIRVVGLEFDFN